MESLLSMGVIFETDTISYNDLSNSKYSFLIYWIVIIVHKNETASHSTN